MKNNKIKKIYEVINENGRGLNLHEIKAMTGVGNGYKHSNIVNIINNISNNITETYNHKSHKINELLNNSGRSLNLHQIKALTGAGSGYRQ
ncbi:Uncharacterised protein [uncultured Clostridium sp.]|uniref:hypothetical protein n=1 Tax=uncultured Clostridium sp. TaxID=59620 RepID=UPI000820AE2B|nr:hypothetical protein [uncultured Clostridium sp.]SCJ89539.1 Uncharacterised protein [uncultured Clostridium sp.]